MTSRAVTAVWVAITVALRVAWLARVPPVIAWDGILYARTALRIAHGLGYVDTWNNTPPWKPTAFYPVGYPALLGLGHALFGDTTAIKEGDVVDVLFHAQKETLLSIELPQTVVLQITYTEPGLRGDTATNTLKPATVETGAEVRVPLFCEEGDLIKIDTTTGAYMERVKK